MLSKRSVVTGVVLMALLVLSGCMDIAIKAKVKPDGSATVTYRTTMDASMVALSKMGDSTKTKKDSGLKEPFNDVAKKPGVKLISKTTKDLPDGRRVAEEVFQAKSVTAFSDSDGPIRFDKSDGKAHLIWPLKSKSPSKDTTSAQDSSAVQSGQMVEAMFAGNTFDFELEMPGKIITAPGSDSFRGSKAFYHKPLAYLFNNDFTIDATSK